MSEVMVLDTRQQKVFVRLLEEGTEVFRPTMAILVDGDRHKLLPSEDYDPNTETWEFPPGSVVECVRRNLSIGEVLVAIRLAILD